jgi:protocatechuate 3,4-dioxygenase beta subunit
MAVLACGLSAQGRPAAKRFTLSGTVVDEKGQPVAGAELSLDSPNRNEGDPVISDGQGRFAFGGLPAGEFSLTAKVRGFGTVSYGEANDPVPIRLGGERGDKSIVFRIAPRAALEGSIRDEFSDPMANLNLSLHRSTWVSGKLRTVRALQRLTDDRGHYRFANLAPGSYQICVSGSETPAPVAGPVDFANRADLRFFAHTCSRAVQLTAGQRAQLDLTPISTPAATVRGHVSNLPPQTGFFAYLAADDDGPGDNRSAFVDATQGTFTFRGVTPGRYQLRVQTNSSDPQKSISTEMPLDVGGEIDGLEVQLGSQALVEVAFLGVPEEDAAQVSALLRTADRNGTFLGVAPAREGEHRFAPIPAGRYWLDVKTAANDCVQSVKLGDREVRGATFDASAGVKLHFDVTISQSCGAVTARAVRDGAAVAGAKVVLLPSGSVEDPRGVKEAVTDDEGTITLSGLMPGRYLIWSWATSGPGAMAGPSSLAAVQPQATTVDVKAGDPVSVDVPLLGNEGKLP